MINKESVLKITDKNNFLVFAGTNEDNIKSILSAIKDKYVDPSFEDLDYIEIYGDEFNMEEFSQSAMAMPMISAKKVIVVRNAVRLSSADAKDLNKIAESMSESVVLVLIYVDPNKYHSQIVRQSEDLFQNAKIILMARERQLTFDDIRVISSEKNLNLSENAIRRILDISDSNPDIAMNLLNTAWMLNNNESFDSMIEDKSGFEIYPTMHNEFLNFFSMYQKEKCFEFYRRLIKWHVISPEGLIMILLSHIEKMKKSACGNGNIRYNKNKWNLSEIDRAYYLFYNVLRNFRTIKKEYAILSFEQVLLNVLKA